MCPAPCYDAPRTTAPSDESPPMQSATSPDYQQLTERLGVSELIPSAAEAHGMLCGLICAGEPDAEKRWLTELFADQDPQDLLVHEAAESLRTLALNSPGNSEPSFLTRVYSTFLIEPSLIVFCILAAASSWSHTAMSSNALFPNISVLDS